MKLFVHKVDDAKMQINAERYRDGRNVVREEGIGGEEDEKVGVS